MRAISIELPLAWDRVGHAAGIVVEFDHHETDGRIEAVARVDEQREPVSTSGAAGAWRARWRADRRLLSPEWIAPGRPA